MRTLDSFDDETIVKVRQSSNLWYAQLEYGDAEIYPSYPDFSTCANTRESAIKQCADKLRNDAIGIGKYAPHSILTRYELHYVLFPQWEKKELAHCDADCVDDFNHTIK